MRHILVLLLVTAIQAGSIAQIIKGRIIDNKTNQPLEYVSIGIINTTFGVITDNDGCFKFEVKGQGPSVIVKISMIGYKPQNFTINELIEGENIIKMVEEPYTITEVEIKPTKERLAGTNGVSRQAGWSGWGGIGKGCEIGTKIELGNNPVKIKSIHVRLHRQSFDTSFYRLHIRTMRDTEILDELLTENIIVSITKESGWITINLQPYNIIVQGDVAVTLEWLKVNGNNEDRAIKINNRMTDAYVLTKNYNKNVGIYRWGTEAKWIVNPNKGPCICLTVLE